MLRLREGAIILFENVSITFGLYICETNNITLQSEVPTIWLQRCVFIESSANFSADADHDSDSDVEYSFRMSLKIS